MRSGQDESIAKGSNTSNSKGSRDDDDDSADGRSFRNRRIKRQSGDRETRGFDVLDVQKDLE